MKENFLTDGPKAAFGQTEPKGRRLGEWPFIPCLSMSAAFSQAGVLGLQQSFLVDAKH